MTWNKPSKKSILKNVWTMLENKKQASQPVSQRLEGGLGRAQFGQLVTLVLSGAKAHLGLHLTGSQEHTSSVSDL